MIPPSLLIMNRRVIFTDYHCMDNIQSVHKGLHLYLVILFLLVVSRILAFNFMLMSVKIRRYRAIIIIIIMLSVYDSLCNEVGLNHRFIRMRSHYLLKILGKFSFSSFILSNFARSETEKESTKTTRKG